ncbi:MAG TPA: TadE family protein [Candidatus Binataceae bacterium]
MAIPPSTKCRRQRAQAMVEFAMVLLVTLTLIFGIIQASLALYAYSFVSYAARSAARYAMVRGSHSSAPATTSSVQTYVQGLAIAINTSSLTVTTSWNPNNNPGSTVSVSVSYVFAPLAPLVWSSSLTMASTAQALITN